MVCQFGDGRIVYGVNLGQTLWGERALAIAKEVLEEFGSNLSLYAFMASGKGCACVRLDKFLNSYGSPTMIEIGRFSHIYGKRLEEEGQIWRSPLLERKGWWRSQSNMRGSKTFRCL